METDIFISESEDIQNLFRQVLWSCLRGRGQIFTVSGSVLLKYFTLEKVKKNKEKIKIKILKKKENFIENIFRTRKEKQATKFYYLLKLL